MLITITTTAESADDLGHLLQKHPDSLFEREVGVGIARVFYPEASPTRTTCALLLEVDPVALVRGGHGPTGIDQYVSDRPYVAGSIAAVALKRCFASAMAGRAKAKLERVEELWPLEARIEALGCAGGPAAARHAFEPLGYEVDIETHVLDETFPEWGDSRILTLTIRAKTTVRRLLNHLYVLLPALDRHKHYWIGEDEVEKLVREAGEWLAEHPAKDALIAGYLGGIRSLSRDAAARLAEEYPGDDEDAEQEERVESRVADREGDRARPLNDLRYERIAEALRETGSATSVIDLGCGDGRLLALLRTDGRFERLAGMDVSSGALHAAGRRLGARHWGEEERRRLSLFQGSLMYRDERLRGYDAAVLAEVIEHIEPERLVTLERVVFGNAGPRTVIVTTPNREYNVAWPDLAAGCLRHPDHRFEWTRAEFAEWAHRVGDHYGYSVRLEEIGPHSLDHPAVGGPTQMALFERGGEGR